MQYIVLFTDGRFVGWCGGLVAEYPDAAKFDSRREAQAARGKFTAPSQVISTQAYAAGEEADAREWNEACADMKAREARWTDGADRMSDEDDDYRRRF